MIVSPDLKKVVRVWPALADILFVPRTKAEYERAVALLDELIDEVGDDENSPLGLTLWKHWAPSSKRMKPAPCPNWSAIH